MPTPRSRRTRKTSYDNNENNDNSAAKNSSKKCVIRSDEAKRIIKAPDREIADGYLSCALQELFEKNACLKDWRITKLLGVGTIGTVFGVCTKQGVQCAAVKVSRVKNKGAVKREIALQKKAYPFAPKIYTSCFFHYKGKEWSVVVMELIDGELDAYLQTKRSKSEIVNIERQLNAGLKHLCKIGMTHGDSVFFNIAYKNRTGSSGGIKVIFIDYDRASDKYCDAKLDLSRMIMELHPQVMAPNMKKPNADNRKLLQSLLLQRASKLFSPSEIAELRDPKKSERLWMKLYNHYCKRVSVKCLD